MSVSAYLLIPARCIGCSVVRRESCPGLLSIWNYWAGVGVRNIDRAGTGLASNSDLKGAFVVDSQPPGFKNDIFRLFRAGNGEGCACQPEVNAHLGDLFAAEAEDVVVGGLEAVGGGVAGP